jgi:general stress protein YciG
MADNQNNSGKQGFASMDDEQKHAIQSKGGQTSHSGSHSSDSDDDSSKGKQGFASMDPEKQKEIASKGGQTSHRGSSSDEDEE